MKKKSDELDKYAYYDDYDQENKRVSKIANDDEYGNMMMRQPGRETIDEMSEENERRRKKKEKEKGWFSKLVGGLGCAGNPN